MHTSNKHDVINNILDKIQSIINSNSVTNNQILDLKKHVSIIVANVLSQYELVTTEEFVAYEKILNRSYERLSELEERIGLLENEK